MREKEKTVNKRGLSEQSYFFPPVLEKHSLYQTECLFPFLEEVKKLKTDIQLERKIFHLTSEKHLQVAERKAKEIKSVFAALTTPLPAALSWITAQLVNDVMLHGAALYLQSLLQTLKI